MDDSPDLLGGDFQDFPFLIVATMRTRPMREALLVAIGALGKRSSGQMIVCAPAVAAGFGMSSFWIWHFMNSALRAFS